MCALVGSWNWERELGMEPRCCDVGGEHLNCHTDCLTKCLPLNIHMEVFTDNVSILASPDFLNGVLFKDGR